MHKPSFPTRRMDFADGGKCARPSIQIYFGLSLSRSSWTWNRGNITQHTIFFPEYNNTQTNFLAGAPIGTWKQSSGNNPRQTAPNMTLSSEEQAARLRKASEILERGVAAVVLVEHWNDSLRLFCRIFQCTDLASSLKAPRQRGSSNQNSTLLSYPYTDSVALQAVQEANRLDAALYQVAVKRFCRDLRHYSDMDSDFLASLEADTLQMCQLAPNVA